MEVVFAVFIVALAIVILEAAYKVLQRPATRSRPVVRRQTAPIPNAEMQRQRQARLLVGALTKLHLDPDFRRIASWAAQSQDLPIAWRHAIFRKFQPRIVVHYADKRAEGVDPVILHEALQALVRHLGIPLFEADHIRTEAERRLPSAPLGAASQFSQKLLQLQREHAQRLEALTKTPGLDKDTREQMLEAETTRFREALQGLSQQASDSSAPPPSI